MLAPAERGEDAHSGDLSVHGRGHDLATHAYAAQPSVVAVVVQANGTAMVLSSATKNFYYKPAGGSVINTTVTCLKIDTAMGPVAPVYFPSLPPVSFPATIRHVVGKATAAGGKVYQFELLTFGPGGDKNVHVTFRTHVARTSTSPTQCSSLTGANLLLSAGIAIYR